MLRSLRHAWQAWRRVVLREDTLWRQQLGELPRDEGTSESCTQPGPPSLTDLVRARQSELKRE